MERHYEGSGHLSVMQRPSAALVHSWTPRDVSYLSWSGGLGRAIS
jgi:hypothetical protein